MTFWLGQLEESLRFVSIAFNAWEVNSGYFKVLVGQPFDIGKFTIKLPYHSLPLNFSICSQSCEWRELWADIVVTRKIAHANSTERHLQRNAWMCWGYT
jgi:hypothetical protein